MMAVALGAEVYNVDHSRVIARGRSHTAAQRDAALSAEVRGLIEGQAAKDMAAELAASLTLTGFQSKNLDAVLNAGSPPKDWEVGEAYSEAYLSAHKQCHFPWSDSWDQRKDKSSLPGSDLVGLQETGISTSPFRFTFGEVKTSWEAKYPPGVMYGEEGLKKQLEDLRDCRSIRETLVRYLMMRAIGSDWQEKFKAALVRFLTATTDVAIFGVLVRDVNPDEADLKVRAQKTSDKHPAKMHIELLAIYLPPGSIKMLGASFAPPVAKAKVTGTTTNSKKPDKRGGK